MPPRAWRRSAGGHWASFVPGLKDGDQYLFYVEGIASSGYKRDPRARLLTFEPTFPASNLVLRNAGRFPWHRAVFVPPGFNDLILYQLHVGTFAITPGNSDGKFFDVISRVPHLAALGVNAIELLPIQEFPTAFSMGYNGTDLYSPENQYAETNEAKLQRSFDLTNAVLRDAGRTPYAGVDVLRGADSQLRALIDLLPRVRHRGDLRRGLQPRRRRLRRQSMYFLDRQPNGDNNNSLYFTDQGWAGGLVFAYWKTTCGSS